MIPKVLILIVMLLQPFGAFGKCSSWTYGQPSFCAHVQFTSLLRKEEKKCFYFGRVINHEPSVPKLQQTEDFVEYIKEHEIALFEVFGSECFSVRTGEQLRGVIAGKCNDNRGETFFGIETFFLKLFNREKLYPDFVFGSSVEIYRLVNGESIRTNVQCSKP
ncbi:MAG: hypothetical protein EOP06_22095 [Proteobacteria bacterium]|nr:MAG: hypothetical protein EOP06_22095 [Pseudomonadota bacterium]